MIIGIGTDIVNIQRIAKLIERRPSIVKRILVESEQVEFQRCNKNNGASFLAKRFAAKEAVAKALGTGIGRGISFQHITITHDDFGKPILILDIEAMQRFYQLAGTDKKLNAHLSISDEVAYAQAMVVLESLET